MTITNSSEEDAFDPRMAKTLFFYHGGLFGWWALVQLYYRLVAPHVSFSPGVVVDNGNYAFIFCAVFVTFAFARQARRSSAAFWAKVAFLLACVDFFCETLQHAPQFGLPVLMPESRDFFGFSVPAVWATAEFGMRSAMFMGLVALSRDVPRQLKSGFCALIGLHWLSGLVSFAQGTEALGASLRANILTRELPRVGPYLGLTWLFILVWLSYRLAVPRGKVSSIVEEPS